MCPDSLAIVNTIDNIAKALLGAFCKIQSVAEEFEELLIDVSNSCLSG